MMERKGRIHGITSRMIAAAALFAFSSDAFAHVTIYKICNVEQVFTAETPEDERFRRTRGAALKGALDAWGVAVTAATADLGAPVNIPVEEYVDIWGRPLVSGYDDFAHANSRSVLCDAVPGGERQFVCNVAGQPCWEVPNCNDPAVVQLGCEMDDTQ